MFGIEYAPVGKVGGNPYNSPGLISQNYMEIVLILECVQMFKKCESEKPLFILKRYCQSLDIQSEIDTENLAENLRLLAIKHFQKYAFHSLHFSLKNNTNSDSQDMPLLLDRNALVQQLLTDGSGSCYHHNAAFQMILEENGIESWFISCLVHNPIKPEETFKMATHVAIVFNYQGSSWLFDPGWNGTIFSIYPLPSHSGEVVTVNNHQVRKTDNPNYPYLFEDIRQQGTIVPRYDFSSQRAPLINFADAIMYLNSKDYAFHTLFIFSRITAEQQIIRLVNRRLIIENMKGEEIHNAVLPEGMSIMQKVTERFGTQVGLMGMISADDFKNPDLGNLFCHTAVSTLVPK